MSDWDSLTGAEPGPEAWTEICRRVEGADADAVAEVAARLSDWPDRERPMPDGWWARWRAGDRRPWYALATHRPLCRLGDYFYVSVAACPNDLGLVLAGSGATGNSDLGEVFLRRSDGGDQVVATLAAQREAVDGLFSPDGSRVVVGFSDTGDGEGFEIYGVDGRRLPGFDVAVDSGEAFEDVSFTRVCQSGDGRLVAAASVAAGAVTVAEADTGRVVLRTGDATGPAALDGSGHLLAYAGSAGQVAVRAVGSRDVLSTWDTGLPVVNALALAPDGSGLVAVGGDRPTACLLTLAAGKVTDAVRVVVADPDLAIDAESPFAGFATRACWTARGPLVFAADDGLSVLFDGGSGRVRWTSAAGQLAGSFTPDGRVLVAASGVGEIDAWFIDSLTGR